MTPRWHHPDPPDGMTLVVIGLCFAYVGWLLLSGLKVLAQ